MTTNNHLTGAAWGTSVAPKWSKAVAAGKVQNHLLIQSTLDDRTDIMHVYCYSLKQRF